MKRYLMRRNDHATPNWTEAVVLTDFGFPWEQRAVPRTEFRALHDAEWLHFRFDCTDHDLVLPDAPTEKDRVLAADRVEIFFAPDLSLKPYFSLEMSPSGDVLAYAAQHYRQIDWDWRCEGLEVAAEIAGSEYSVTGRIPLATLRALAVLRADSAEIHAGVFRAEFFHREDGSVQQGWMPWVDPKTPKPDFHVPAAFGLLVLAEC